MILKYRIKKLLKRYETIFDTHIDQNSIGVKELYELKILSLEEIATAYDILEGYKVSLDNNLPIPAMSRYAPNRTEHSIECSNNLIKLKRMLDYQRHVNAQQYLTYPDFNPKYVIATRSDLKWKQ